MTYQSQRISPCRVSISGSLTAEQVGAEREKVTSSWARAVRLDGFRKGKAPRSLVERKFEKEIQDDLVEGLVRTVWLEAREGETLRVASPLEVRRTTLRDDGGFEVEAELDVYPTIELAPVEGFTPPEIDIEPASAEVDMALEQLRERQAVWEPADGEPVAEGLLVEAEVHGEFPDGGGEPFHEERSLFQLGRGEVYPEIEAAVTGRAVGDEVTAERVMPEQAGEERAGKRISYRIKVKSLRRKRVPEADDAFAASLGIEGGAGALRERVRERVRAEKLRRRYDAWREALVNYLGGDGKIALPERLLEEETRKELLDLAGAFAQRGIDPRTQVEWEKLHPEVRQKVERRLWAELVLDTLADSLGIEVTDAEVDAEVEKQARSMGVPFAEVKGNLAKRGGLETVRGLLRRERAVGRVLDGPAREG